MFLKTCIDQQWSLTIYIQENNLKQRAENYLLLQIERWSILFCDLVHLKIKFIIFPDHIFTFGAAQRELSSCGANGVVV